MRHAEVLIVGGGPAGSSCAWALRRRGFDVLILDREAFPRIKPCAGWISREALDDLQIGTEEYPGGLTRITRLAVYFRGLKLRLPARLLAVRRSEFDTWLLKRSGVPSAVHRVRNIVFRDGKYVVDDAYSGKFLVGAGGTGCPVARTFFAATNSRPADSLIVTLEEEFPYEAPQRGNDGVCRLWFGANGLSGYGWYVPKQGGFVNVGVGGNAASLRRKGDTIRRHWDLLTAELESLSLVRRRLYAPKGHVYYLRRGTPQMRRDNSFVIGDAAGLATADMGEGIGPAVRSGLVVADAIADGGYPDAGKIPRWSQPRPLSWIIARGNRK